MQEWNGQDLTPRPSQMRLQIVFDKGPGLEMLAFIKDPQ